MPLPPATSHTAWGHRVSGDRASRTAAWTWDDLEESGTGESGTGDSVPNFRLHVDPPLAPPRLLPRSTILAVDDDPRLLDLIIGTFALEMPDAEVRAASTAAEAERAALAWTPDLILCDVRLPDGDGRALLERLRRHPRLAHVPSVLMTALDISNRLMLEEAAALHADFLRKPFDLVDLLSVAARALAISAAE